MLLIIATFFLLQLGCFFIGSVFFIICFWVLFGGMNECEQRIGIGGGGGGGGVFPTRVQHRHRLAAGNRNSKNRVFCCPRDNS